MKLYSDVKLQVEDFCRFLTGKNSPLASPVKPIPVSYSLLTTGLVNSVGDGEGYGCGYGCGGNIGGVVVGVAEGGGCVAGPPQCRRHGYCYDNARDSGEGGNGFGDGDHPLRVRLLGAVDGSVGDRGEGHYGCGDVGSCHHHLRCHHVRQCCSISRLGEMLMRNRCRLRG